MKEQYKDESIFNGVAEYIDGCGNKWRREDKTCSYHFYEWSDKAEGFVFKGELVKQRKKKSLKDLHHDFLALTE